MAAKAGHHIPGTSYTYRHGWIPRDLSFRDHLRPDGSGTIFVDQAVPKGERKVLAGIEFPTEEVGKIHWNADGHIAWIRVAPHLRRKGIATELLRRAKTHNARLKHGTGTFGRGGDLTPDGRAFAVATNIADLSNPYYPTQPERGAQTVHTVTPPPNQDALTRTLATILVADVSLAAMQAGVIAALAPLGVVAEVAVAALGLAMRGTRPRPNAKLADADLRAATPSIRVVQDADLYYRAAYLINAAMRMQREVNEGKALRVALADESTHYRQHEQARAGRLKTAAQVATAAQVYGPVLGWYLNPFLNNEPECIAANGHNFRAEEGTVIGLPGSVHANCGCYAGPPHEGAAMVNDVLHNVIRFGAAPKRYKIRTVHTA